MRPHILHTTTPDGTQSQCWVFDRRRVIRGRPGEPESRVLASWAVFYGPVMSPVRFSRRMSHEEAGRAMGAARLLAAVRVVRPARTRD